MKIQVEKAKKTLEKYSAPTFVLKPMLERDWKGRKGAYTLPVRVSSFPKGRKSKFYFAADGVLSILKGALDVLPV